MKCSLPGGIPIVVSPGEPCTLDSVPCCAAPLSVGAWFALDWTNLFELTLEGNKKLWQIIFTWCEIRQIPKELSCSSSLSWPHIWPPPFCHLLWLCNFAGSRLEVLPCKNPKPFCPASPNNLGVPFQQLSQFIQPTPEDHYGGCRVVGSTAAAWGSPQLGNFPSPTGIRLMWFKLIHFILR